MQDFEKLGAFYLGRRHDLATRATGDALVLYDSRDLVTHAAIIGMTGSGKTGLGIDLLEEAAIDGVPAIAIDPKGDLGNLLLTFPDLSPASFRPWVDPAEAARRGVTPDAFAEAQAEAWRTGLGRWGQDAARIARLRQAVDLAIYTPGSTAGLPLSILKSFDAPPPELIEDGEVFAERVTAAVTGLLTLAGLVVDPVTSREHILLSTIVATAWRNGEPLDLPALIGRVQTPPMQKVGVLELDAFFPAKDRFELAMRLNNLLASPAFATWLEGEPLDVGQLLYTPAGTPRLSVISIAHLGDAERMFFVSMLCGQVLSWMRRQAGTTSLRAILYMDEVAGYLPPTANPPSKAPLLTLLKQARAFGVGLVLATQNPVDLDYKALSNIGTWLLGRLQTERDKLRVLDGLEGALSGSGHFDRGDVDRQLSALGKRIFLLHNVHDDGPTVFETRWAMSYLAGPLTRDQIRTLMAPRKAAAAPAPPPAPAAPATTAAPATPPAAPPSPAPAASARPVLPPDVPQFFVPARALGPVRYQPRVFCVGSVAFTDAKLGVNEARSVGVLATPSDGPTPIDWQAVAPATIALGDLDPAPDANATFDALPAVAGKARSYAAWEKEFARWLYATQTLDLLKDAESGLVSAPGEQEREFRIRLQQALRERRDAAAEKLRQKYAPKLAAATERLRKAEQAVAREKEQAAGSMWEAGATLVGALFGNRRLTTAASGAGRVLRQRSDVGRAAENVEAIKQQIQDLDAQLQAELEALAASSDAAQRPLASVSLTPKKTNVTVQRVVLAWVPAGE